jgi:hypothetical protein
MRRRFNQRDFSLGLEEMEKETCSNNCKLYMDCRVNAETLMSQDEGSCPKNVKLVKA